MESKRGTLSNLRRTPHSTETYDSHLERDYMLELEQDPSVREWTKRHGVEIRYWCLGIPRRYLPDFLVTFNDGSKELHETKGLPLMFWLTTKLKRESAEQLCAKQGWRYKMITRGWKRRAP